MPAENNKSVHFNLRFSPIFLKRIKFHAESNGYISIAQFIREAVAEKLERYNYGK